MTNRSEPPSPALIEALGRAVRRMSAQSVLTGQAVAARFGLHTTDLECMDLLAMGLASTPGELSAATGLSSGAMTALLDRLEKGGFLERRPDPDDRRRVRLHLRPDKAAPIEAVYAPMQRRMTELWAAFSAAELQTVIDFATRSTDLAARCLEEMEGPKPAAGRRRR